jgi:glycosyltransferase involved in cell wall biosynthesis
MAERRLLVVSFHFPPRPGVASARVAKLVRHLPELGWAIDVVAATSGAEDDPGLAEGLLLDQVVRVAPRRFLPRLQRLDWAVAAAPAVRRLSRRADVVLISGGPFAPFALGPRLGRPYVLDLRDPWGWEPRFGRFDARLRRRLGLAAERTMERAALRGANALVTVTPEIAERYEELDPALAGRFEVVRHGWEPDDFPGPQPELPDPPALVYAGTFLSGERTPQLVVDTVERLRAAGSPLRLRLVGSLPNDLRAITAPGEREGWIDVTGRVPAREAAAAMRRATVLWAQPGELPFLITGKVYDYLAARRPIVAAAPADGALARLLGETGGGVVVTPAADACASAVAAALDGRIALARADAVADLAAPRLAEHLARVLEQAAS